MLEQIKTTAEALNLNSKVKDSHLNENTLRLTLENSTQITIIKNNDNTYNLFLQPPFTRGMFMRVENGEKDDIIFWIIENL